MYNLYNYFFLQFEIKTLINLIVYKKDTAPINDAVPVLWALVPRQEPPQINLLFANAFPDPDFKYFSNASALYLSENAM